MTDTPQVDWSEVAGGEAPAAKTTTAETTLAAVGSAPTPPELPELIGRLPIKANTRIAVLQLPEPVKGVSCAAVFANSSVLSDCERPSSGACSRPAVKFARPLNDREIEVEFWDGEEKVVGPGWKQPAYPGGQPETRFMPVGVPFVEVKVVTGRSIQCGCDPEKWASDNPYGG